MSVIRDKGSPLVVQNAIIIVVVVVVVARERRFLIDRAGYGGHHRIQLSMIAVVQQ